MESNGQNSLNDKLLRGVTRSGTIGDKNRKVPLSSNSSYGNRAENQSDSTRTDSPDFFKTFYKLSDQVVRKMTVSPKDEVLPRATRKTVAKGPDVDFVPSRERLGNSSKNLLELSDGQDKEVQHFKKGLIRLGWAASALLFLRLIFMENGMIDYYGMQTVLADKSFELTLVKKENDEILKELKRIRFDSAYQKKLVRDLLGLVGKDEYLILFAKERAN